MAQRQTLNVSLPQAQERFVRSQVDAGRYRTASEVVREGLRLLEATEHRRLVEKWLYDDLTDEELAALPSAVRDRVKAHFRSLIGQALEDVEDDRVVDGPSAVERLREELRTRHG